MVAYWNFTSRVKPWRNIFLSVIAHVLVSERHAACSLQTVLHWEQTWWLHDLDLGLALAVQCTQTREWLEFALRSLSLSLSASCSTCGFRLWLCPRRHAEGDAKRNAKVGVHNYGCQYISANIWKSRQPRGVPGNSRTVLVFEGLSTVNTYLHWKHA